MEGRLHGIGGGWKKSPVVSSMKISIPTWTSIIRRRTFSKKLITLSYTYFRLLISNYINRQIDRIRIKYHRRIKLTLRKCRENVALTIATFSVELKGRSGGLEDWWRAKNRWKRYSRVKCRDNSIIEGRDDRERKGRRHLDANWEENGRGSNEQLTMESNPDLQPTTISIHMDKLIRNVALYTYDPHHNEGRRRFDHTGNHHFPGHTL